MHLIFDTETTGLPATRRAPCHPAQPYIMQLGAQLVDDNFQLVTEVDFLIQIPDDVTPDPRAIAVTGITKEMCRGGVTPRQAHGTLSSLIQQASHIVAHNLAFDGKLWEIHCARLGLPNLLLDKHRSQHCTMIMLTNRMRLPGKFRGSFKWPNLKEAYSFVTGGKTFDGAHDAMADVRAVTEIWRYLQVG